MNCALQLAVYRFKRRVNFLNIDFRGCDDDTSSSSARYNLKHQQEQVKYGYKIVALDLLP